MIDKSFGFGVAIPGFGNVPVGGQQAVSYEKSGARDARADRWRLVRKPDLIDAVDVTDGISITIQHQRRHCLLFLEFCNLLGELSYLAMQFVWLHALRSGGRVVVE